MSLLYPGAPDQFKEVSYHPNYWKLICIIKFQIKEKKLPGGDVGQDGGDAVDGSSVKQDITQDLEAKTINNDKNVT